MKNALTRTIIVCVALNLITAGFALAQEGNREVSKEVSIAADVAQVNKEAETARRQLEAVQKQMEHEIIMMAAPLAPRVSIPGWQYSGIGSILVIPTAQMKTEDLAAITEDMAVMSRIFDKKLSQAHLTTVRSNWSIGIDPRSFGRSSGAIEAIYLDGYGALFLMKVNALLSPPPEALEEKVPEEEDIDPLWTQTIQEMYAPEEADRLRRRTDRPEEKYDVEKVEELKETLIKTLKHAANIRTLKPDESVILSVTGKAGQSATRTTTRSLGRSSMISSTGRRGRSIMGRVAPGVPTVAASLLPTVLTIRAKKSDIDAFANGTLSFDQFSQKIVLLSYSYLGENIGDRPSRSSGLGGDGLEMGTSLDKSRRRRGR